MPWEKCCSLTLDDAAVMNGVCAHVKAVATNCVLNCCIIHREAMTVKLLNSGKQRKTKLKCFRYNYKKQ